MKEKKVLILSIVVLVSLLTIPFGSATTYSEKPIKWSKPPLPGELDEYPINIDNPMAGNILIKHNMMVPPYRFNQHQIIPLIQQLKPEMTIGYIENLTSFGPRVTASEACSNAADYIFDEFSDMGLDVRYQNWSESSSLFGSNIEATLTGIDHQSDEIYVVCAHYDSVYGSPGADDNAAGTSVVLAAAEIMSKYHFNHTVKFVTFSGEEQGLHGSRHYATEAAQQNDNIVAVLNADMMGYAPTADAEQYVTVFDNSESAWITSYTTNISEEFYDVIHLDVVHGGFSGRSDHASFHNFGFHAIFYFEYDFNPFYHSRQDTLENMNPWYATNVSRLSLATLVSLSELTEPYAPEKPSPPMGRVLGKVDVNYTFISVSTDPNNDDIWYKWDWGDGSFSDWIGPFASGEACERSYTWQTKGEYQVRVKVKDNNEYESEWSDPLSLSMAKNKQSFQDLVNFLRSHSPLFIYFQRLLNNAK